MSLTSFVAILLALAPMFAAAGALADQPEAGARLRIQVHGHRGAMAAFPQNTLPAFRHAMEVGADYVELDLAVTADDQVVIMHDVTVNPEVCLGPDGAALKDGIAVRSLTLLEIKKLDCGTLPSSKFPEARTIPGTRIPTLAELFELANNPETVGGKTIRFNIELKGVPARTDLTPTPERFIELVLEVIRKHGMEERVMIQSFDHRYMKELRQRAPAIPISLLIQNTLPDLVAMAAVLKADVVAPDKEWITAEDVKALHEAGVRVVPWTVNDEADWKRLIPLGVDGIITDDPAGLIEHLRRSGLR
jgi:glycerophosphoryl diester phosphodiesterase